MLSRTVTLAAVWVLMLATLAGAADWPHFRGPRYDGSTEETGLPTSFGPEENIAWEAELPGPSAATPIVYGDSVFVASTDLEDDTLNALCFDRDSGELRWEHEVAEGVRRDRRSNFASSSPVTDGQVVVFFYGNGDLVAYDFEGKELWKRDIQEDYGEFAFLWTFSSTPLLYRGKLYLQVLQRDVPVDGRGFEDRKNESYLLAMDPSTGETLWRHVRPSRAVRESREAFSSPIPYEGEDGAVILVAGGDALTAHDPDTGDELWRWGTWNPERIGHWRLVPSPVAGDGIALVCAPKRDPIYAIRMGGDGRLGDDSVAWVSDGRSERVLSSDVPTPAFYDGDFFVLSDVREKLSRVEPETGEILWSVDTPGLAKYEASPLAADGKIWCVNFKGTVVAFDAEDGEVVHEAEMGLEGEYPIRSSIVAAHGHLFIRLNRRLVCVGGGD